MTTTQVEKAGSALLILCIFLAVSLGLAVRMPHVLGHDFPLNDGGLFAEMIQAIQDNGYRLPDSVEYNKHEIPFAYPPLAFYLAASVSDTLHISVVETTRWLPLVLNILSIALFVLVAGQLCSPPCVVLSAVLFPLIPRSYEWFIMGGGVPRSAGLFFCLLALYIANRMLLKSSVGLFAMCALTVASAALCHPEWGLTAFVAVAWRILSAWPNRHGIGSVAALPIATAALASPWWLAVALRHGADPFLSASGTSGWAIDSFAIRIATLQIFGVPTYYLAWLSLLGWIVEIRARNWFMPVWLVLIFLTTPRHAPSPASIPQAILSAVALHFLEPYLTATIHYLARRVGGSKEPIEYDVPDNRHITKTTVFIAALAACYLLATTPHWAKQSPLRALGSEHREAMLWIRNHTPAESRFVVLSEPSAWPDDYVAEWFPVLTDRESLTTAQGLEWVTGDAFRTKTDEITELKRIQKDRIVGLEPSVRTHFIDMDYVAIFSRDPVLRSQFRGEGYRPVYRNGSALLVRVVTTEGGK